MDVKCITKQQNSSDLWPLKVNRDCIVDKSLKIYLMQYVRFLITFVSLHWFSRFRSYTTNTSGFVSFSLARVSLGDVKEIKSVHRGLGTSLPGAHRILVLCLISTVFPNLETRARNTLWRLAEALGNTSESRALIGCFSSANYYSNFEPYLVIQISNIV